MGITIADNFNYQSRKPLDGRLQYATIADMKAVSEDKLYNGCFAYVTAEKKYYSYDSSNESDVTLGKWREYSSGGTGGGHAIEDEGTALTQRDTLNFIDFDMEDDSANEKTQVAMHELTSAEMEEIMSNPPGPSTPTDFDDLTNRPTKNVTSMADIITPLPSIRPRQFKYSTDEQVVGEWIDGKPVYQKTITGTVSNNGALSIPGNIDIRDIHGFCKESNLSALPLSYYYSTDNSISHWIDYSTNSIKFNMASHSNLDVYITLIYTKTTD